MKAPLWWPNNKKTSVQASFLTQQLKFDECYFQDYRRPWKKSRSSEPSELCRWIIDSEGGVMMTVGRCCKTNPARLTQFAMKKEKMNKEEATTTAAASRSGKVGLGFSLSDMYILYSFFNPPGLINYSTFPSLFVFLFWDVLPKKGYGRSSRLVKQNPETKVSCPFCQRMFFPLLLTGCHVMICCIKKLNTKVHYCTEVGQPYTMCVKG